MLFSDESNFNVFGSEGRKNDWKKQNTELEPRNLRPTIKHNGGSVLIWGCMASSGVGNVVFIDGIMDKTKNFAGKFKRLCIKIEFQVIIGFNRTMI